MAKVLDLINDALVRVKALAVGETAGPDMTTDALDKFNEILEALSIQNLAVFSTLETTFALVGGKASYTIGPTGDVAAQRPNAIDGAFVSYGLVDFPLDIKTDTDYARLSVKTTGGIPQWLVWVGDYPNATLKVWPVPDQPATLTLYQRRAFTAAATLADTVDLPPGYRKMIRLLLAWELQSDYPGMTVAEVQKLEKDKNEAVGLVKRENDEPVLMRSEAAAMGSGNGGYTNWRDGA